jgi:NADH-quinone oxidoreductase subunit J
MASLATAIQWILGLILILSSAGVLLARRPIHASLSFLLTLFVLAVFYSELSAEFIAVMQVLVYAGAILVIFVFVIVLFQDAHQQIGKYRSQSRPLLLGVAITTFLIALLFFARRFIQHVHEKAPLTEDFGSVQGLGQALYLDFFFPFEAVIVLFLVAIIGSLYIAKKDSQ